MNVKISIILPTYNEELYIEKCLESIVNCDYPKDNMELLIVDGNSTDSTVKIIKYYCSQYSYIKYFNNPHKYVPFALNIGIKKSTGELIVRIDAHSEYSHDYFSKLVYWSRKLDADNVGGICRTEVIKKDKIGSAIAAVLSDKFGVGNSSFRTETKEVKEVDTVPFGCFRRDVFERYGLFDERLTRNQDIEFNKRIKNCGAKIYLVPDVQFNYFARNNYKSFIKNNFSNGLWNILTVYYTKSYKSLSIRHFIPMIFCLSIIAPIILTIFSKLFIFFSLGGLLFYLLIATIRSFKISKQNTSRLYIILSFTVLHISYGFGSLFGIIKIIYK